MRISTFFAAILLFVAVSCRQPTDSPGPSFLNLVVVLADTLRAANLPPYGYPRANAPRISRLAEESILFENHFANYPGTPISVSQMMTGRLTPPLLMSSGMALSTLRRLEEDLLILPRVLREAGYVNGLVSSHHWFDKGARILRFFDETHVLKSPGPHPYAPMSDLLPPAESFLRRRAADARPFFLYVHSMDTHLPHRRRAETAGLAGWGPSYDGYDRQILYTDRHVGRILDLLDELDLGRRTLVVFTSDHGEDFGEMGPEWWNRSHGNTLRRSQLHVPLIVRIPGVEPRRWSKVTRHVDLAPTLLSLLLPGSLPQGLRFDGTDLSDALRYGTTPVEALPSLAYTWRYWALHFADHQVIYDQWEDRIATSRFEPDERNFPRPVQRATREEEHQALKAAKHYELRRQHEAPALAEVGGPIGVPNFVVLGDGTPPSYEQNPSDDRWFLKTWMQLEASPGENPPPLVVWTPWVEGTYRLFVRLHPDGLRRGFKNRFLLEILGSSQAVDVDGTRADDHGFVDAGVHRLGPRLGLRFSDPQGGVSVAGFFLTAADGEVRVLKPAEEKRLRALGYLE